MLFETEIGGSLEKQKCLGRNVAMKGKAKEAEKKQLTEVFRHGTGGPVLLGRKLGNRESERIWRRLYE